MRLRLVNSDRPLHGGPPSKAAMWWGRLGLVLACCVAPTRGTQAAHEPFQPDPGDAPCVQLVPVRLPLVGKDDQLYRGAIQRVADELAQQAGQSGKRPVLVLEMVVDDRADPPHGRGGSFSRSLELARFLVSEQLANVKTVAYVPRTLKGHGVLLATACEAIAMAPDAELGEAAIDEVADKPIGRAVVAAYQEIAEARRTVPTAIVVGWVDRRAEVYRAESEDRIELVLGEDVARLRQQRTLINEDLLVPAGAYGLQTGRQGRELGFVKYLAQDRAALARALGVEASLLDPKQPLLGEWRPAIIDLDGPITQSLVSQLETLLGEEIGQRQSNWIGLRIDSSGGDLEASLALAQTIAELDENQVRTVAYVPREASGGAALVALACDQLVMHEGAKIGGGESSWLDAPDENEGRRDPRLQAEDDREPLGKRERPGKLRPPPRKEANRAADDNVPGREPIEAATLTITDTLAPETNRTASLLVAMVDPEQELYVYTNRETAERRLLSPKEQQALPDAEAWRRGGLIVKAGEVLTLSSDSAAEQGVAWQVVETFDDLKRLYGFDQEVRVAKANWANELVKALASPQLAMLLLMIAFVGVYVELNMPGTGFGGFIAALAFVLFFWSKFTVGSAEWLEVMLFLTGVVCILIEVLVLPGLGVFGLGGAVLVLVSLVLASQTFLLPQTESQLVELRTSLSTLAGSLLGFMVVGAVMRRYLPTLPMFRRMQLAPPEGADRIERDHREAVADYAHLIGAVGMATTDLLPAGKADFDGELVDVIAEGDIVEKGAKVVVLQAKANRVIVQAMRS